MADDTSLWLEEERQVRAKLLAVDVVSQEELLARPGLDFLNAILAGELPPPPIGDALDFVPISAEHGKVIFQGRPQRRHYNPLGSVHGGWFATLLDSAVGCAIHSVLLAGQGYTTLELKVNMIRALTEKVPVVRAEGSVIHVGRQAATAEGRIFGPDGRLYAHATTTCMVFEQR